MFDIPFPTDVLAGIGVLGACAYITNYTMLALQIHTSETARFYALNTLAAACVLTSLAAQFNLATAVLQTFYLSISGAALALRMHSRRRPRHKAHRDNIIPLPRPRSRPERRSYVRRNVR
ncbi:CBU_0592 family membrane protein [Sagittula sp. SSi028]|uniref:CBU_0592 family membrane protein n=1 Tax=Sagittula sp. SSi028 TaxID=3400636 RepID=UPI003AF92EFD